MIKVEVLVNYPQWKKKIKKIDFFFKEVLKNFPKKYRFPNQKKTLTLLLSDNKNIKKLNSRFRKKNKPTDILSFPLKKKIDRNNFYLGDIIISYQFIEKKKVKIMFCLKKN